MMKIPLHCVVLLVGPAGCGKSTWAHNHFPAHELLSFETLQQGLCGDVISTIQPGVVWEELRRQVDTRISQGQRAVVDAPNLKARDRLEFASIAEKFGVDVFYIHFDLPLATLLERNPHIPADIMQKSFHTYQTAKREIASGDKARATVVSTNAAVTSFPTTVASARILAVGDVHGNWDAMQQASEFASEQNAHIVWLGDVVDYGKHNLKCVRLAYDTVKTGRANMIWGNHERKIDRWIQNNLGSAYTGRLSEANLCTAKEILSINKDRQRKFLSAWTALRNWSHNHLVVGHYLFTHGAATPGMWTQTERRLVGDDSNMAYFGEVDRDSPMKNDGYPNRVWNWVNSIPNGHTVVVGHDWLDRVGNEITVKTSPHGGTALAVDCGSSKGGRLGCVLIDLEEKSLTAHYF